MPLHVSYINIFLFIQLLSQSQEGGVNEEKVYDQESRPYLPCDYW